MKKIILAAFIAVSVISCKKEVQKPLEPATQQKSTAQQVEELIRKASPKTYERMYGSQKTALPSSHIHHGVFHWPASGNPADGTCLPNQSCVCFVCVDFAKFVTEESPIDTIGVGFHRAYANPGDGTIIINAPYSPFEIGNLKSLDVSLYDGDPVFYYTLQE